MSLLSNRVFRDIAHVYGIYFCVLCSSNLNFRTNAGKRP